MDVEAVDDLLPEIDREFLREKGLKFSASKVGADVHIVLHDFEFPKTYAPTAADLLIVLPAGYPNAKLDMFYTRPDIKLVNGNWPNACQARAKYGDVEWQQWSRHFK